MAILYKYFPLACDEHLNRLIRLLDGWIYFSDPLSFNDPFEMSPVIAAPEFSDLIQIIEGLDTESLLTKSAKKRIHTNVVRGVSNDSSPAVPEEWIRSIGVLCLTQNPKDILMWAHYASNHTGICVGFDTSFPPFSAARSINYSDQREHISMIDFSREDEELIQKTLFTKSSHWRYENEWRATKRPVRTEELEYYKALIQSDSSNIEKVAEALASEGGPGIYQFDNAAIRRIYYGTRINNEFMQRIEKKLYVQPTRPKRFQIELDSRYYWLNEVKV